MPPTSFCDVTDLLAVGLECIGTPGTALRIAMTTYMPNRGMNAPPTAAARRGEGKRQEKNRSKFKWQRSKVEGQKANGKDGMIEFEFVS